MKENRFVLPIILILLVFFLPLTGYGIIKKIYSNKPEENPNHLHFFENKLYFYDNKNELISVYACENDMCIDAQNEVDDEYLKYYQGNENNVGVFGDYYVLIKDGTDIKLYNLNLQKDIATFEQIKNYGTQIGDGYLIIKNTNGYGLFNLNELNYVISPQYSFMGINERYIHENFDSQKYAVETDEGWFIINSSDEKISSVIKYPIYDYNDNFILCFNTTGENYLIYDYEGNKKLSSENILKIDIKDEYIVSSTIDGNITIYNNLLNVIKEYHEENRYLSYKINDDSISITDEENEIDIFNLESSEEETDY